MPVEIGEIQSEVVVEPPTGGGSGDGRQPLEVQVETLRAVVREVLREELERLQRTAAAR